MTTAFLAAAGVPALACVLAVVGIHAVDGAPSLAGLTALAGVPFVDGVVNTTQKFPESR